MTSNNPNNGASASGPLRPKRKTPGGSASSSLPLASSSSAAAGSKLGSLAASAAAASASSAGASSSSDAGSFVTNPGAQLKRARLRGAASPRYTPAQSPALPFNPSPSMFALPGHGLSQAQQQQQQQHLQHGMPSPAPYYALPSPRVVPSNSYVSMQQYPQQSPRPSGMMLNGSINTPSSSTAPYRSPTMAMGLGLTPSLTSLNMLPGSAAASAGGGLNGAGSGPGASSSPRTSTFSLGSSKTRRLSQSNTVLSAAAASQHQGVGVSSVLQNAQASGASPFMGGMPAPMPLDSSVQVAGIGTIHTACVDGNLRLVEYLIKTRPDDAMSLDIMGCTPLHVAACYGHTAIIRFLLAQGVDVDARDMYKSTPLCVTKSAETVELLVGFGASIDSKNVNSMSARSVSLSNPYVRLAIENGLQQLQHRKVMTRRYILEVTARGNAGGRQAQTGRSRSLKVEMKNMSSQDQMSPALTAAAAAAAAASASASSSSSSAPTKHELPDSSSSSDALTSARHAQIRARPPPGAKPNTPSRVAMFARRTWQSESGDPDPAAPASAMSSSILTADNSGQQRRGGKGGEDDDAMALSALTNLSTPTFSPTASSRSGAASATPLSLDNNNEEEDGRFPISVANLVVDYLYPPAPAHASSSPRYRYAPS